MIGQLKGEFSFLSNFHPCSIFYEDIEYPSVEHAYQAAKTKCVDSRKWIASMTSPGEAKRKGRLLIMRNDWDDVKVEIMMNLCSLKFSKDPLKSKLVTTFPMIIQEGNWWGDTFWGVCNGQGCNVLGKILMRVRANIMTGIVVSEAPTL